MAEVLKAAGDGVDFVDWSPDNLHAAAMAAAVVAVGVSNNTPEDSVRQTVVLHDRLMTDAVLCPHIKVEHSYSLNHHGVPAGGRESPGQDNEPLTLSRNLNDMEDDECFPCISLDSATGRSERQKENEVIIQVKEEPMSDPGSPESLSSHSMSVDSDMEDFLPTPETSLGISNEKNGTQQSILKQTSSGTRSSTRLTIKLEPGSNGTANGSGFSLPPTPPSSTNSDSESANGSNNVQNSPTSPPHPRPGRPPGSNARVYMGGQGTHNRQPIQTPLISSQPKGSTGTLLLTEEEKRTLLAEGYPIPTRLPLTKSEEKSLKKIRRKIKNKISAQESRRKKKEYMDALERKVEVLAFENSDYKKKLTTLDEIYKKKMANMEENYKKKISILEDNKSDLMSQLKQLKELVAHSGRSKINGICRSSVK